MHSNRSSKICPQATDSSRRNQRQKKKNMNADIYDTESEKHCAGISNSSPTYFEKSSPQEIT